MFTDCPGTGSENAGKASACAGCPNQQICASTPKGPDPGIRLVKERLEEVKNKILVLSGKGGVGKSTATALLSRAIATNNSQFNVSTLWFYHLSYTWCKFTNRNSVYIRYIMRIPTYSIISTSPFFFLAKNHFLFLITLFLRV